MSSNLTWAGWLLVLLTIPLIIGMWWVMKFQLEWEVNPLRFFPVTGGSVIGGGAWALNRMGFEIIK